MAENQNDERNLQEEQKIDLNLREIISKANKNRQLTKAEIEKLESEARKSLNFLDKIDEIEIPKDKYVVFTDGQEQLIYDNGEFFLEDTVDSTKVKRKKKRAEAREMYIEYFIKYTLNKIAMKNNLETMVKNVTLEKEKSEKVKPKEKTEKKKVVVPEDKKVKSETKKKTKTKDDDIVR